MDWVCDNCGRISLGAEMIYMNTFQKSKDSSMAYFKNCFLTENLTCEKCHNNIQSYICECSDDFRYVCKQCKCDNICNTGY